MPPHTGSERPTLCGLTRTNPLSVVPAVAFFATTSEATARCRNVCAVASGVGDGGARVANTTVEVCTCSTRENNREFVSNTPERLMIGQP